MGGEIEVKSAPREGARFVVHLGLGQARRVQTPGGATADKRSMAIAPRPTATRLLVADDHPVNLEVIQRQLELLGPSAETAENGATALAKWRNGRHAVVLLDLHMPELDGFGLAKLIRSEEAQRGLPRTGLIAVTADAVEGKKSRCLAAGIDGFVTKPVSIETLTRALEPWISNLTEKLDPADSLADRLFDPQPLRGLFGGERLTELVQSFANCAARDLAALRNARTARQLAMSAHRLKGAARTAGANGLAEQAGRIEAAAKAESLADARRAAEGMEALLTETLRAMWSIA